MQKSASIDIVTMISEGVWEFGLDFTVFLPYLSQFDRTGEIRMWDLGIPSTLLYPVSLYSGW